MRKIFKCFLLVLCMIFTYQNISAVENNLTSTANKVLEKADSRYKIPEVIVSYDQWKEAIYYCFDNLIENVVLVIDNYDESVYSIETLDYFNVSSAVSEGKYTGKNRATMKYSFKYKENYKLTKAAENIGFILKLDVNQIPVYNKARLILNNIINENMSDYEKEKAIHDYMVSNYSYAPEVNDDYRTIKSLLETGQGVCEAYAYTFEMFCKLAGVECRTVVGTSNGINHGWNMVKLDNEYYHVDVTADDPVPDKKGNIIYDYFNVTDEMISKDHVWDINAFPECVSVKYNYFYYKNIVFENKSKMQDFVIKQLALKSEKIEFYTKGFVINDVNDFSFCSNNKNVKSLSVCGNFGNGGVFVIEPVYQ